jgi:hypothetical protein
MVSEVVGSRRRTRSIQLAVAAAVLGGLMLAGGARPADAALEIRLAVSPANPVVGVPVSILIRTYGPDLSQPDHLGPPVAVPDYAFLVEAVAPSGSLFAIPFGHSEDPYVWRGILTFAETGDWIIWVRNCETYPDRPLSDHPNCALRVSVSDVPPALAQSGDPRRGSPLALAAMAVLLVMALLARRRGKTKGPPS